MPIMPARAPLFLPLVLAAATCAASCSRAEAQPAPPASASAGGVILAAHNERRARHCAPPLAWSGEVARAAQAWADRLARDCSFQHSTSKYGENLWAGTDGAFPPRRVVESWYGEVAKYDFKRPGFSMDTGHFTQLVWVGTKRLGCGTATCKGNRIWVCNYDPAGNVEGQFREHVRPTGCRK
jgi:pathogenesis-related protein 1